MTILLSPFQVVCFFISFSYLIALAGTSNTMLNKDDKSECLYLVPDLRGDNSSFSLLNVVFAVALSHRVLLCWGVFPLCLVCWEFYHKSILNLSNAFLVPIGMIIWLLFFILLMWYITLTDLWFFFLICKFWTIVCILRLNPTDYVVWSF